MTDDDGGRSEAIGESVRVAKDVAARGGSPLGRAVDPSMFAATTAPADVAFRVFKRLLDTYGLRYALYSILRLTDYRFISVFRFEDGMIGSLAHVDREDLSVLETSSCAESASYCCYVRTENGPFTVVDSRLDPRVEGHIKQQELRSYCGVPILSAEGALLGTLCHYDPVPRDPAQLNAELLAQVVNEIVQAGMLERRER